MYFHNNTHTVLKSDEKEGVKSDFLKKKWFSQNLGKWGQNSKKIRTFSIEIVCFDVNKDVIRGLMTRDQL